MPYLSIYKTQTHKQPCFHIKKLVPFAPNSTAICSKTHGNMQQNARCFAGVSKVKWCLLENEFLLFRDKMFVYATQIWRYFSQNRKPIS